MEVYAVKVLTWIEDYYRVDELCEDGLFLNLDDAISYIENLDTEETLIQYNMDSINYRISYDPEWFSYDISNEDVENMLYRNERAKWYYIKKLFIN